MVKNGLASVAVLCLAMMAGACAAAASPAAYNGLVVFGDSLSDSGNVGRFTDGPIWVEIVADRMGVALKPSRAGGTNYAVAGALTNGSVADVRGQVTTFLAAKGRRVDPDSLYIVYGGANNLLATRCAPGSEAAARTAASAIRATVDDLAASGARHILVPNLPDIGRAPVVQAYGAECAAQARRLSELYNAALERGLQQVEAKHAVDVRRLDVFALADRVMVDPQAAGFRDTRSPCNGGPCDGALFWDFLHPSSGAHARLAQAALDAIGVAGRD